MNSVTLRRIDSTDHGTFGILLHKGEFAGFSLEPPWRGNMPNRSCIPVGWYDCMWHKSPRYGWTYMVTGVKGRSHILIHSGNLGGDAEYGFKTHTKGCILLGKRQGYLGGQRAVLVSRPMVRKFLERMDKEPFVLIVEE